MNKETKRQLLMSISLIAVISLTLFLWFNSFEFQTYTKITDKQLCYQYSDETLKIDGYELFMKNNVIQSGGARIAGIETLKNDKVIVECQMTKKLTLIFNNTIKTDNQIIYLNYQTIEEDIHLEDITSINMNISIQRNKKIISKETIELNPSTLIPYTGSNKDYSIANAYLGNNWFKAGYFHCLNENISDEYPTMVIDYMYSKNEDNLDDYARFIHIETDTKDFLEGLTDVYFFEDNELKDKEIVVVITLKGDDEFTFKINLSPTISEGEQ